MKSVQRKFRFAANSFFIKLLVVAVAAVGGGAIVSSSVVAALQAAAFNQTPHSIGSGSMSLTLASGGTSGGFTTAIAGMAPGDTVNRYVNLTLAGSIGAATPKLAVTPTGTSLLDSDATKGLQVAINVCATAWTAANACTGGATVALASTAISTMTGAGVALTNLNLASPATNYLQVAITLPNGPNETVSNGNITLPTIQGLTSNLTWTFTMQQRQAATTNS